MSRRLPSVGSGRDGGAKVLVIGYGNPLRRDDGVGPYVAERVARYGLPGVTTCVAHQLQVEMAADLAGCDAAFLVDASAEGPAMSLRRAEPSPEEPSFSHQLTPERLLGLTETLYGRRPSLCVCTVRGQDFGFGSALSGRVFRRAERLARRILRDIKGRAACRA